MAILSKVIYRFILVPIILLKILCFHEENQEDLKSIKKLGQEQSVCEGTDSHIS